MMVDWFCGYTLKARDDWEDYVVPPRAPSNYKDPAKIDSYLAEAREKMAADVPTKLLAGRVDSFVVLSSDAKNIESFDSGAEAYGVVGEVGSNALKAILAGESPAAMPRMWGIQLPVRIHQMAIEAFETKSNRYLWGLRADGRFDKPHGIDRLPIYDPVKMLFGESNDDTIGLARGICGDEGVWTSAEQMASFVRNLARRFNMVA